MNMNYRKDTEQGKKDQQKKKNPGDTSSPIRKTEGSADISSSSAEFNASRTVI
jgi:hypothetical protein